MRRCSLAPPKIKAFHCPHAVLALTTAFPPGSQAGERSGRDTLSALAQEIVVTKGSWCVQSHHCSLQPLFLLPQTQPWLLCSCS